MTTYGTTYGCRSTGVRRGLMTSPPQAKARKWGPNEVNGGLWDG